MTNATKTARRNSAARNMTWAWLALTAITIGSWWLAPAHVTNTVRASTFITGLVLVLAFIKSRLIIQYFMEVRTAPRWLRRATDAWLIGLVVAMAAIYLA